MGQHAAHLAVLAFGQRDLEPGVGALLAVELGLDGAVAHALDGDAAWRAPPAAPRRPRHARARDSAAIQPLAGSSSRRARPPSLVSSSRPSDMKSSRPDRDHARHALGQRVEDRAAALRDRAPSPARRAACDSATAARGRPSGSGLPSTSMRLCVGDGEGRRVEHLAVDLDAAGRDPALGIAARAQAGARQPLGDPVPVRSLGCCRRPGRRGRVWRRPRRSGTRDATARRCRSGSAAPRCPRSRRRAPWRSPPRRPAHRPPPGDARCSPAARRRRRCRAAACPARPSPMWPGSLRGLGCSCASASATESGMCWISLPPSTTCRSCWPPQMPSTGLFAVERALGDGELEGGAAVLGDHRGVRAPPP